MKTMGHIGCAGLLLALGAAGCSRDYPPPPHERNELVVRFFQSIQSGNSRVAAVQARKLHDLDPSNEYVMQLVTMQESNSYVAEAQKSLNSGDVEQAVRHLEDGVRRYPANSTLRRMLGRARQLRNAPKLFAAMRKAGTSSTMEAALTAAMTGLADNPSPELDKFFSAYELKIKAAAAREAKLAAERDKITAADKAADAKLEKNQSKPPIKTGP